jgi:PKD repeat protein
LLNPLDQAAQSDAELAVLEDGSLAVAWSDLRHGAENIYASPISIESQVPPAAAFYAAPVAGGPGLAVTFQDQSSGWVGSWAWSFGDGGSSTLPDPLHTYIEAGSYSVSLTVAGPWGTDALNQPDLITIHQPPQADFGAAPQSGSAPLQVSFSNLSTGYTDSWWDFGDGLTSTLPHPTHAYTSPGFYTVTLIVDGPGGSDIEIKSDYIAVFDLPSIYLPVIQKP